MPRTSPYGTWASPISAADVAAAGGGAQWLDVRPWVVIGRSLYFTHWDDQPVYMCDLDSADVSPVTPEPESHQGVRYGDLRRDLVAFAYSEIRSLAASHHFLTAPEAELPFYGQVFGFETPGVPRLELQR